MALHIGQFLHSYRKAHRLTQKEMATKLGVTRVHYARLESGTNGPSAELLETIKAEIGTAVLYVFTNQNGNTLDPVLQEIHEHVVMMEEGKRKEMLYAARKIAGGVKLECDIAFQYLKMQ